jgi:hypothetical protein
MRENLVADVTPQAHLEMEHTNLGITVAVDNSPTSLQKGHKDLRDLLANLFPGRIDTMNECLATSSMIDHTVVTFKTIGDAMNCAVIWHNVRKNFSECFLRGPVTRGNRPAVTISGAGSKTSNVHPRVAPTPPPRAAPTFILEDESDEDEFTFDNEWTENLRDPTYDVSRLFR